MAFRSTSNSHKGTRLYSKAYQKILTVSFRPFPSRQANYKKKGTLSTRSKLFSSFPSKVINLLESTFLFILPLERYLLYSKHINNQCVLKQWLKWFFFRLSLPRYLGMNNILPFKKGTHYWNQINKQCAMCFKNTIDWDHSSFIFPFPRYFKCTRNYCVSFSLSLQKYLIYSKHIRTNVF